MAEENRKESVWIPLQTIYNKELKVAAFLQDRHIEHYIPMMYELSEDTDGKCKQVLVPAIHNLLFIRHAYDKDWCYKLLQASPHPIYFLKRERNGVDYCVVSEKEMQNFMRATDPSIQGTRFIDSEKLKSKEEFYVRIAKKGPLYGITGKFVRYGGKHYIAVEMPQSTALLKVSYTWCEVIPNPYNT